MDDDAAARIRAVAAMAFDPTIPSEKEEAKVWKVKTDEETIETFTHYVCDGVGGLQVIIPHVMGFQLAIEEAGLDEPSKSVQFRKTVAGSALSIWADVIRTMGDAAVQAATFNEVIQRYLRTAGAADDARHNQIEGLMHLRKPKSMTCHEWQVSFQLGHDVAALLPGAAPVLDDASLKRVYLKSYPDAWSNKYIDSKGNNIADHAMHDITAFMNSQAAQSAQRQRHNEQSQRAKSNKGNGTYKRAKKGRPTYQRNGRDKYRQERDAPGGRQNKSRNQKGRGKDYSFPDKDLCPIHKHGKHSWAQCYQNPDNKNKDHKSGNGNGKDHNHAMETDDNEVQMTGFKPAPPIEKVPSSGKLKRKMVPEHPAFNTTTMDDLTHHLPLTISMTLNRARHGDGHSKDPERQRAHRLAVNSQRRFRRSQTCLVLPLPAD